MNPESLCFCDPAGKKKNFSENQRSTQAGRDLPRPPRAVSCLQPVSQSVPQPFSSRALVSPRLQILELLWAAVQCFNVLMVGKSTKLTKTKPQVNQNVFCFSQVIYKGFHNLCLSLLLLPVCTLRSLSAPSLPLTMASPMGSLPHVRALCWGHQNCTQDFGCSFLSAE